MAEADAEAPAKKKGNWKLIVIVIVAILLTVGLSVGATLFFMHDSSASTAEESHAAGKEGDGEKAKPKPAEYYEAQKPFIVTLNDSGQSRYFQVFVAFMAHDKAALDGVQSLLPDVRNQLLILFGSQDFMALQTDKGKHDLQKAALDTVNGILKKNKAPPIEQVLFTNFVLQ